MAEGIFPVIEIDAGRQLDVIVTRGARLQIRNLKRKR
jgi:conjugal transfer pilus assembly protein TraB